VVRADSIEIMLDALKRLLRGPSDADRARHALGTWCTEQGYTLRSVKQSEGFVIDGKPGTGAWRLEWGPSQRRYVKGHELRLRCEPGLAPGLQALVLDKPLQQEMEREVFEEYVEDTKTRIDTSTPPEMRWLVMLQKIKPEGAAPWKHQFSAVANDAQWASSWLGGVTADALARLSLEARQPMVLMLNRGRLTLRTAMQNPDPEALKPWVQLFECATASALAVSSAD